MFCTQTGGPRLHWLPFLDTYNVVMSFILMGFFLGYVLVQIIWSNFWKPGCKEHTSDKSEPAKWIVSFPCQTASTLGLQRIGWMPEGYTWDDTSLECLTISISPVTFMSLPVLGNDIELVLKFIIWRGHSAPVPLSSATCGFTAASSHNSPRVIVWWKWRCGSMGPLTNYVTHTSVVFYSFPSSCSAS